ncbi:putative dehydrogenase [Devosia sp. UYZn731]
MTGLRWGVLGLGGIAAAFTKDLIANNMTVSAVGSRSLEKATEFADTHWVASAYGSYDALAASNDVDAIYVATPHPFHAEAAALAIRAGKHVLIEKPITLNAQQAAWLKGYHCASADITEPAAKRGSQPSQLGRIRRPTASWQRPSPKVVALPDGDTAVRP